MPRVHGISTPRGAEADYAPARMAEEREIESSERSLLERTLGVITEVRAGEGPTALLLTLNVFLLLCAYYVIKPVREGLILSIPKGAEYKSYLGGVVAIALLFAVPIYGAVADRVAKHKLVVGVTLFFALHLVFFYAAGMRVDAMPKEARGDAELWLAVGFFSWVGIFSMMIVAQFWAFANDLYAEEQGKRLFALVGIGASAGGVVGAAATKALVEPLGTMNLLLVCATILCASAGLTWLTATREGAGQRKKAEKKKDAGAADKGGTFTLVFRHRYLTLIAVFALLFTFVNTNGEFILSTLVKGAAGEVKAAAIAAGEDGGKAAKTFTTGFYGDFFLYVNVLVMVLQTFAVSRIVKFGGLRIAFFILPIIALVDALGIAAAPVLAIIRIGKIAENATDYSVNNTVRNMLWLPTTTEMKYKAKQAVDTFFVRAGDVASAGLVWLATREAPGWSMRTVALINIALVVGWLAVARGIIAENAKMTSAAEKP